MKLKLLIMLLALPIVASCASLSAYMPQVTLQTSLSDTIYNRNLTITNATGYFAELEINCQTIGIIAPNDTFYASWLYDFSDGQAAITLTFWKTPNKTGYVGAASNQFYNYSAGNAWTIKNSDIITPDGYSPKTRRIKTASPESYSFNFPRIIWHSTTLIQMVNNTPYPATVNLNGQSRAVLNKGDTYCAQLTQTGLFSDNYQQISIAVIFPNGTYSDVAYSYPDQEQVKATVISKPQISN
ncbi:MAG: hypothetical protein M1334_01190 [Patescibacteria group bacterium]|nr:hypothetical protein [Patescibacteria group bacterium]